MPFVTSVYNFNIITTKSVVRVYFIFGLAEFVVRLCDFLKIFVEKTENIVNRHYHVNISEKFHVFNISLNNNNNINI